MDKTERVAGATLYEPRKEARVLAYKDLTEEQKQAAQSVHALLRGYLQLDYKPASAALGERRFTPHIDNARWNQNVLLDGERGSGKTSLLVTMLDLWNITFARRGRTDATTDDDQREKVAAWGIDDRWSVVPLSVVDLQPVPGHTPVLLHLATCLVRVVEAIEEREGREGRDDVAPPWLGSESPALKSRRAWEDLVRAIVAGWDAAAGERWRRQDAENAEFEVNRAVRGHQDLVSNFHGFVDHVIEDFKRWRGVAATPLFVLPIDDADMNAGRARELIEALRMLHHPRLVFLLTGHSELFLRVAEVQCARELDDKERVFSKELAHRIYDKVIPPSHRCAVAPVEESRRAGLLPQIRALRVPSTHNPPREVPLDIILKSVGIAAGLPSHLRLLRELDRVVEQHATAPATVLMRLVERVWQAAVEHHPVSSRIYTSQALSKLVQARSNPPSLQVTPFAPRLIWNAEGVWEKQTNDLVRGAHRSIVQFASLSSLRLSTPEDEDLPEAIVSAHRFAELVALEFGTQLPPENPADTKDWWPRFAAALYRTREDDVPLSVGWPRPAGLTLRELSWINLRWSLAVQWCAVSDDGIDAMARWFLAVIAQLSSVRHRDSNLLPLSPSLHLPEWGEVAERIVRVAEHKDAKGRDLSLREWAIERAVLLATPESGLPNASAASLLTALKDAASPNLVQRIRERGPRQRLERLRHVLIGEANETQIEMSPDALRQMIDEQQREHPWMAFVARSSGPPANPPTDAAPPPAPPPPGPPSATPAAATAMPAAKSVDPRMAFFNALGSLSLIDRERAERAQLAIQQLPKEDDALIEELVARLDNLRDVSGAQPYALRDLLKIAAERNSLPKLGGHLAVQNGNFTFSAIPGAFDRAPLVPHYAAKVDDGMALEFNPVPTYALQVEGRQTPPIVEFLFRIAWDWREINSVRSTATAAITADWCDTVRARLDRWSIYVPWPCAPWPTFQQQEAFRDGWGELLEKVTRPRGLEFPAPDLARMLAQQYVEQSCCFRNPQMRNFHFRFDLDFQADYQPHTALSQSIVEAPPRTRHAAKNATFRWLRSLALLLAPESLFPHALLTGWRKLLAGMTNLPGAAFWLSRDDIQHLRVLRLDRLRNSLAANDPSRAASAQEILDAIDREMPATEWNGFLKGLMTINPMPP